MSGSNIINFPYPLMGEDEIRVKKKQTKFLKQLDFSGDKADVRRKFL